MAARVPEQVRAPEQIGGRRVAREAARSAQPGAAPALLWSVLALVLLSFGLLVAALVTSRTAWAWGSVLASGLAAGLLASDWVSRRNAARAVHGLARPGSETTEPSLWDLDEAPPAAVWPRAGDEDADLVGWDHPPAHSGGPAAEHADRAFDRASDWAALDPEAEPPEERADVADAIVVADLTDPVVVIDERPRYHLAGCRWVGERETMPLPLAEARELGFTPCAVCGPDRWLAARHRARSR